MFDHKGFPKENSTDHDVHFPALHSDPRKLTHTRKTVNSKKLHTYTLKAGSQYDATHALHGDTFTLILVGMQHDARIDSDSILAFLCVGFLCLIVKKSLKF